jgi:hypothetical protein
MGLAMRRTSLVLALLLGLLPPLPAASQDQSQPQPVAWEHWQHLVGIVDVGARADGTLVAMIAGQLALVSPTTGEATPFATGPGGFTGDPNAENYFVVAQPLAIAGASCSWTADDVFILDLGSPLGIDRVDSAGKSSRFVTLSGVDTLSGIAQDTTGAFGHRLLVTGTHNANQTTVFAIDCQGTSSTITTSAPVVEGGLAVAPSTFGTFAGDLIGSDENSGQVWAVDPSGSTFLVVVPNLPTGGDTGVESEGFVPPSFVSGGGAGFAYLADRGTPDNPFPGTDSLLRLSAAALASAGVQDGDLLIATEGNGTTIAIRCAQTCTILPAAQGPPAATSKATLPWPSRTKPLGKPDM